MQPKRDIMQTWMDAYRWALATVKLLKLAALNVLKSGPTCVTNLLGRTSCQKLWLDRQSL